MRLNIQLKLFMAILSAHFLLYLAMYSAGYYSFTRGFLEYVSRIEERQVPALVDGLVKYYEENGSWDPLRADSSRWIGLLRQSIESSSDPDQLGMSRLRPLSGFSQNDWYYTSEYSPARPYLH